MSQRMDDSGYGIGPEFTLDTRDNVVVPPDGGGGTQRMWMIVVMGLDLNSRLIREIML